MENEYLNHDKKSKAKIYAISQVTGACVVKKSDEYYFVNLYSGFLNGFTGTPISFLFEKKAKKISKEKSDMILKVELPKYKKISFTTVIIFGTIGSTIGSVFSDYLFTSYIGIVGMAVICVIMSLFSIWLIRYQLKKIDKLIKLIFDDDKITYDYTIKYIIERKGSFIKMILFNSYLALFGVVFLILGFYGTWIGLLIGIPFFVYSFIPSINPMNIKYLDGDVEIKPINNKS